MAVPYGRRGFTLIELLLAIGLMGLMLGLSLPRIGAIKTTYFATEEAKELANTIRAARIDAIYNRTTVGLMISSDSPNTLEGRRLEIQTWHQGDFEELTLQGMAWRNICEAPLILRSNISGHLEVESPEPGILFFANGSSSGGEILFRDDDGHLLHQFLIISATGELIVQ